MPRIEASSIDEHVRVQEERLLRAAIKLFREQGYSKTDMGSIAAAIGLARSSIYRYYPNKDYVLLACISQQMAPLMQQLEALRAAILEPKARIAAWLDLQLELATSDIHFGLEMIGEIRKADAGLRQRIAKLHEAPGLILGEALDQIYADRSRSNELLRRMIMGMVNSSALFALENGSVVQVKSNLRRSVAALIETWE